MSVQIIYLFICFFFAYLFVKLFTIFCNSVSV